MLKAYKCQLLRKERLEQQNAVVALIDCGNDDVKTAVTIFPSSIITEYYYHHVMNVGAWYQYVHQQKEIAGILSQASVRWDNVR